MMWKLTVKANCMRASASGSVSSITAQVDLMSAGPAWPFCRTTSGEVHYF